MTHPHPNARHIHHHHVGYSYPVFLHQRLYGAVAVPLIVVVLAALVLHPASAAPGHVSVWQLASALVSSMVRLTVAYVLAALLSLPLALLINRSTWTERVLLPAFDILQSVPVLAFFPVVIVFFLKYHFLEGAAEFILFITMLWSMVFSLVGGLRLIPGDIHAAARVFGIKRFAYVRKILIPAVFPYLVTGSLLSWASGWNILIVAEVLHTYLPGGSGNDLFGIGSVMVHASASGSNTTFIGAIVTMVIAIALMNFFIWQRLLRYSERYRFE